MKTPKVSVLMTVYNGEKYLREALDSILIQSFEDFELVIIDDGSTDASHSIVSAINDTRIRLVCAPHAGLVAALNLGLSVSQGEFIARMDADDVAHRDRLAIQLAYLESRRDVGIVCSDVRIIDSDGRVVGIQKQRDMSQEKLRAGLLFRKRVLPIIHPSVMMRREVPQAIGGYRAFDAAEDRDFWLRALDKFEFNRLDQTLLDYRIHSRGISREKGLLQEVSSGMAALTWIVRRNTGVDIFDQHKELFAATSDLMHERIMNEVMPPATDFRQARTHIREHNNVFSLLNLAKIIFRHGLDALPDGARKAKLKIVNELAEHLIVKLARVE